MWAPINSTVEVAYWHETNFLGGFVSHINNETVIIDSISKNHTATLHNTYRLRNFGQYNHLKFFKVMNGLYNFEESFGAEGEFLIDKMVITLDTENTEVNDENKSHVISLFKNGPTQTVEIDC
jgi:hypothetical protein